MNGQRIHYAASFRKTGPRRRHQSLAVAATVYCWPGSEKSDETVSLYIKMLTTVQRKRISCTPRVHLACAGRSRRPAPNTPPGMLLNFGEEISLPTGTSPVLAPENGCEYPAEFLDASAGPHDGCKV